MSDVQGWTSSSAPVLLEVHRVNCSRCRTRSSQIYHESGNNVCTDCGRPLKDDDIVWTDPDPELQRPA